MLVDRERDNYLRFYFRFVRPNLSFLAQQLHDLVEKRLAEQLRAFVGVTAMESFLCLLRSHRLHGRCPC